MGAGLVAAGCKSGPQPAPLGSLNAQQAHGHEVFQERCGRCHYDRQSGSLHGPSLVGVFKKPSLPSGAPANEDRVMDTILHGHGLMPAMGNAMDPEETGDLMAYLRTL